jgi:antirestriction protein ArdC
MARAVRYTHGSGPDLYGGMDPKSLTGDRANRLVEAHRDLVNAVESLTSGEDWQRMLELAARFHHYSANNVFLIMLQRPDATRVAGYQVWRSLGRRVRKGERGIRILVPCRYRYKVTDNDGIETAYVGIRGFTTASVFDVTQTDGDDLPEVRPILLDGDDQRGLWEALGVQVVAAGYTVERGDCNGANGYTDHTALIVRIRDDVSGAQATKTLCHELAHVLLHPDAAEYVRCRGRSEVEAESVAFLVCQATGFATDGYSWPYIAHWSGGETKVVQDTASRVLEAARMILTGVAGDRVEA